ncbi:MAG: hypothetical protein ACREJO_00475 [Phycisphaerales bacterium]
MHYPVVQILAPLALATAAMTSPALAGVVVPHYLNETNFSEEADFVNLQFPYTLTLPVSTSTGVIYGRIYEAGMTPAAGAHVSITAQLGYGPAGSDPLVNDALWTWFPATFNVQNGNDDEYQASFTTPASPGTYWYTFRFNLDPLLTGGNVGWTLADIDGAGSNNGLTYNASYGATPNLGVLTVVPSPSAAALASLASIAAFRRRR